jgi:hypothetical protein
MPEQRELSEFLKMIAQEPALSAPLREKAEDLSKVGAGPVFQYDIWIYRGVVAVLGITVLSTIIGGLYLAFKGDATNYKLPSEIVAIGSAAVGALAGLLAPAPQKPA